MEHLHQLLTARRGLSRSRASLKQRVVELPHAAPVLQAAIAALAEQIAALDQQIAALAAQFPEMERLDAVDGIGPVTAAAAAACLIAKQFGHPDAFVAYVGLDTAVDQSGQHEGRRRLTKQGDAELRRLFYCCAQSSLRSAGSPFRAQYERELAKGLPKTGALCAVARKLARVCWSLWKHGGSYDRARVYQQPGRKTS